MKSKKGRGHIALQMILHIQSDAIVHVTEVQHEYVVECDWRSISVEDRKLLFSIFYGEQLYDNEVDDICNWQWVCLVSSQHKLYVGCFDFPPDEAGIALLVQTKEGLRHCSNAYRIFDSIYKDNRDVKKAS